MSSVLIIDDEPNVCYSLQRALEIADADGLHRRHGPAKESRAIRRNPPDAVILDVRLPDMSGLDAYSTDPPASTPGCR